MKPLKRVLLVDDDAVTNMLHRRVIERSGQVAEISVATDGQEALNLLNEDIAANRPLPELVFLDINMPGMGGFKFLEHYDRLQISVNTPLVIVMLSTSLLEADQARATSNPNVHSFCDKPLRLEKLLALIQELQK